MASLSATIKSIQNLMRQDAGVDGDAQRISQLVWLLFLKIFDDKEQDDEAQQANYQSPIPEELRWRSWAANDEGLTGDKLLEFVNGELFPRLKELTPKGPADRAHLVRSIFEDSYNYMKSGTLLRQVVTALEKGIDYTSRQERHLFNDIYEQILRDLQSAGNAGEFYTPRAVTQLLTELVAPTYAGGRLTMDPACGTGGFLVSALEYMRAQQPLTTAEQQHDWQHSVRGYEKKPLPHSLATTNLLLHGVEVPQAVQHVNTLKQWKELPMVDFILTNPPFGGLEESAVASGFPVSFRTTETADLFLYLLIEKLKPGGRAGVVLPDGSLFGESGVKLRVKEHLLQECHLHTIVRLPNGVFAPYTGIRTNLLLFDKGRPTTDIWYYEHPYPAGVKNYSKTRPVRIEEFDELKQWIKTPYANENAWQVSIADIKARGYNLDIKNPHQGEIEREYSSEEILSQLEASFAYSLGDLEKFREAVQDPLPVQDPTDEPVATLLARIHAEKQRLIKAKKLRPSTPLLPLSEAEVPYAVPQGWVWCRLGDIMDICSGVTKGKRYQEQTIEVPYLAVANVQRGFLQLGHIKKVSVPAHEIEKYALQVGDLLMTEGGDADKLGRGALWNNEIAGCIHQNHIFRVRALAESVIPEYALSYINSDSARAYFLGSAKQTTNLASINLTQLKNTPFPLPPLPEQQRIVAKVAELLAHCTELEAELGRARAAASALHAAALREAFRPVAAVVAV